MIEVDVSNKGEYAQVEVANDYIGVVSGILDRVDCLLQATEFLKAACDLLHYTDACEEEALIEAILEQIDDE